MIRVLKLLMIFKKGDTALYRRHMLAVPAFPDTVSPNSIGWHLKSQIVSLRNFALKATAAGHEAFTWNVERPVRSVPLWFLLRDTVHLCTVRPHVGDSRHNAYLTSRDTLSNSSLFVTLLDPLHLL